MSDIKPEAATDDFDNWLRAVGYGKSQTVEKLMEHIFLANLLQECWFRWRTPVEVLRSEVDASGYDLVLEADGTLRHVQLKASRLGAKTARQTINSKLQDRQGGCIVWAFYAFDRNRLRVDLSYRWRDLAVDPLPGTIAKNTRSGKPRPMMRVVPKGGFRPVDNIAALVELLFPDIAQPG